LSALIEREELRRNPRSIAKSFRVGLLNGRAERALSITHHAWLLANSACSAFNSFVPCPGTSVPSFFTQRFQESDARNGSLLGSAAARRDTEGRNRERGLAVRPSGIWLFPALAAVLLGACSPVLEATRPTPADLSGFQPGDPRDSVIERLGPPLTTSSEADGTSCDMYQLYTKGYGAARTSNRLRRP
jgi:hypothetical protein